MTLTVEASTTVDSLMCVEESQQDVRWLKQMLQHAVNLEFATIPPYLYALWSVKDRSSDAAGVLQGIAWQEMFHMGLACNLLSAIGEDPAIAPPSYPGGLPGKVKPDLKNIRLEGLKAEPEDPDDILRVFMEIEAPEKPLALWADEPTYPTIKAFYDAIRKCFTPDRRDLIKPNRPQATGWIGGDRLFEITDREKAAEAIDLISEQGEGAGELPLETPRSGEKSHYYRFAELWHGRALSYNAGAKKLEFGGARIVRPAVHPLGRVPVGGWHDVSPELRHELNAVNAEYGAMLKALRRVWSTEQAPLKASIDAMIRLDDAAKKLIECQSGAVCGPEFLSPRGSAA
ncbi:ferritin-like domain-containing protein [Streptomyces flavidovirens]|uniref:ferritin-like domain-containing protein n=1 Tax=Streptomyces flavidovirens TaxID=67298 RepID=UPI000406FD79|nr:ferritin-like protein [Streptomyces flavidovirens]